MLADNRIKEVEGHPARLTDAELGHIWREAKAGQSISRLIDAAAARQVVEWLDQHSGDMFLTTGKYRVIAGEDWQALRTAVGITDDDEARRNAEEADMQAAIVDSERAQEAEDNASYARAIGVDREGQL